MLSPEDRRRLARIERQLRRDDPAFAARMSPADGYRPPRSPLLLCCLIWLVVPALAAAGRWPGALAVALIATVTTVTLLWLTRQRPHRSELGSPWLP